jgi:hypothetical protein
MPLTPKIDDIMDRSSGQIDPDYLSKPRPDTTVHRKPAVFVVPELPWKTNGNQLSNSQQQQADVRHSGVSTDAGAGHLGVAAAPAE